MTVGVNPRHYEFIFSLNRQSDILTPIATSALKYQRSIRTFAPSQQDLPAIVSDRGWYGKGHSHATFFDVIQKRFVLNTQERSATNLEALFGLYYVMGDLTSEIPDTAGNPNEWLHRIRWQTLGNREVLYTSIMEIMGDEWTKILSGAWLNTVTFTANRADHIVMSFEGGGRKQEDVVLAAPGMSEAVFFKTLFGTVKFGPSADPLVAIPARVYSWNLTVGQNATPAHRMGNAAGEEQMVTKVMIGDQVASGEVVIEVDKDHRDLFLNQTMVGLELICKSPDVIDTSQHTLTFKLPNLKIAGEGYGEDEQSVTYTMTFSEDSTLKPGADEHLEVELLTDIDDTEIGVVSS